MNESQSGEVDVAEQNAAVIAALKGSGYELMPFGQDRYVIAVQGKSKGIFTINGSDRFFEPFKGHDKGRDYSDILATLSSVSDKVSEQRTQAKADCLDMLLNPDFTHEMILARGNLNQRSAESYLPSTGIVGNGLVRLPGPERHQSYQPRAT